MINNKIKQEQVMNDNATEFDNWNQTHNRAEQQQSPLKTKQNELTALTMMKCNNWSKEDIKHARLKKYDINLTEFMKMNRDLMMIKLKHNGYDDHLDQLCQDIVLNKLLKECKQLTIENWFSFKNNENIIDERFEGCNITAPIIIDIF